MQTQQIELRGDIGTDVTLANIMGAVKLYPNDNIEFIVSSWGGYVDEAWRIYDYLKTVKNVSVIFKDYCCSATTFAFLSLPLENRKAYENTQFAIHLPFNSYFFADMNVENLETSVEVLQVETDKITECYIKDLNITEEEIKNLISPDSFFNETAAKGFEMISEILENKEAQNDNAFLFDLVFAKSRIAAFYPKNKTNNNQNNNEMSETKELIEEVSGLKALINKISAHVFPPKALTLSTEEGVEVEIKGEKFENGAEITNEIPDGKYTAEYMDKKYTFDVANKKVANMTEIVVEPNTPTVDSLKTKNAALKQQLLDAQAKAVTTEKEVTTLKADFKNIKEATEAITSKCYNPDSKSFNFAGFEAPETKVKITKESAADFVSKQKAEMRKNKKK